MYPLNGVTTIINDYYLRRWNHYQKQTWNNTQLWQEKHLAMKMSTYLVFLFLEIFLCQPGDLDL